MAALGGNFIRVRVHFDYPPPAVVDCRMCWLLVDLNTCRVVADLESIIRDKFGFSRRSILNLFVEDCYLPHTESVYVVRDNDSVRVKVDSLPQVNGGSIHPEPSRETCRKRQRPAEGDELGAHGASEELKKKKRKKGSEENVENVAKLKSSDESKKKKSGGAENDKKKKKKKVEGTEPKKTPAKVGQLVQNKPKTPQTRTQRNVSSSDSSSSSSEEDAAAKKAQKPAPKPPPSAPAASKAPQKKQQPPPSSSSSSASSSSSSDEAASTSRTLQNKPQTATESRSGSKPKPPPTAPPPLRPVDATRPALESEEEITLVIKQPKHPPGFGFSQTSGAQAPWRGRGRGMSGRGGAGPRGRGDSRGGFRANGGGGGGFETKFYGATEPSYETDSLTNSSVVLQNASRPDYSSLPLLAAPPQVGQKIAFKLLELTENYTPEVSEYKEATILSFDHSSRQVELELQSSCQAPAEPGKFDLVYQNPDGSERVEYAVSRSSRVNELWDSLLEPRLII